MLVICFLLAWLCLTKAMVDGGCGDDKGWDDGQDDKNPKEWKKEVDWSDWDWLGWPGVGRKMVLLGPCGIQMELEVDDRVSQGQAKVCKAPRMVACKDWGESRGTEGSLHWASQGIGGFRTGLQKGHQGHTSLNHNNSSTNTTSNNSNKHTHKPYVQAYPQPYVQAYPQPHQQQASQPQSQEADQQQQQQQTYQQAPAIPATIPAMVPAMAHTNNGQQQQWQQQQQTMQQQQQQQTMQQQHQSLPQQTPQQKQQMNDEIRRLVRYYQDIADAREDAREGYWVKGWLWCIFKKCCSYGYWFSKRAPKIVKIQYLLYLQGPTNPKSFNIQ